MKVLREEVLCACSADCPATHDESCAQQICDLEAQGYVRVHLLPGDRTPVIWIAFERHEDDEGRTIPSPRQGLVSGFAAEPPQC